MTTDFFSTNVNLDKYPKYIPFKKKEVIPKSY